MQSEAGAADDDGGDVADELAAALEVCHTFTPVCV